MKLHNIYKNTPLMNAFLHREYFGLCKCASKSILLYVPCVLYEQFTFPGTKAQRAISFFDITFIFFFLIENTKILEKGHKAHWLPLV